MATAGISLREWSLSLSDYETEEDFRAAVQQELASFEHIGERLGVGLVSAPIRARAGSGAWFTAAWVFKTATVPAARETATEIEALEEALTGSEAE